MDFIIYMLRCIIMLIVAWIGVRFIGKKSIAEMSSYELATVILLVTVAAAPIADKELPRVTVGIFTIVITTILLGFLSLNKFFYIVDTKPIVIIAEGKIIEKELKRVRMSVPLLISELRVKGYQNVSDIRYAILEPSGKMSVIPRSQVSPVTPKEMGIPTAPVNLSIPLIIDGKVDEKNLMFLHKDKNWLLDQLQAFEVGRFEEVLLVQYDSSGQLFVNVKNREIETPNIY